MQKNKLKFKDAVAETKRRWIRITRACNNKCLFCLDSENQNGELVPKEEILKELGRGRTEGATRAILSGGDPTLHPEIFYIIQKAKKMGYGHVQIITNGRMLAYDDFTSKLKTAGLDEVTLSLHSHLKKQLEEITQIEGSYEQAMKGLLNALKYQLIVSVDIVINKINYKTLKDTMNFFIRLGVSEFDLLYLVPFGSAWENRRKLFIEPAKAEKYLNEAFILAKNPDLFIWTNRLPAIYLEGHEQLIQNPIKLRDEIRGMAGEFENYIEKDKMISCHGERCKYCFMQTFCQDVVELKGKKILKSKDGPACLPKMERKRAFFEFSQPFDIYKFLDFFVEHRYFVKSLRCAECRHAGMCSGAGIQHIRKNGFQILKSAKVILQNEDFYVDNNFSIDQLDWLLMEKNPIKKTVRLLMKEKDIKNNINKARNKNYNLHCIASDSGMELTADRLLKKSKKKYNEDINRILYVSYSVKTAKALKKLEDDLIGGKLANQLRVSQRVAHTKKIGNLLGYPKCCINLFSKHLRLTTAELNFIAFKNSKEFFWELNNLDGKMAIIPHIPCSYDCKKSLEFAQSVFRYIIKEKGNVAAERIRNYLKSPFLYFRSGRFIRLDGHFERDKFHYSNIFYSEANTKTLTKEQQKEEKFFYATLNTIKLGSSICKEEKGQIIKDAQGNALMTIDDYRDAVAYVVFK